MLSGSCFPKQMTEHWSLSSILPHTSFAHTAILATVGYMIHNCRTNRTHNVDKPKWRIDTLTAKAIIYRTKGRASTKLTHSLTTYLNHQGSWPGCHNACVRDVKMSLAAVYIAPESCGEGSAHILSRLKATNLFNSPVYPGPRRTFLRLKMERIAEGII